MMTNTIRLAKIEDIIELARQIKDNWALCELFDGKRRAFEAEYLVAETVHACKFNHATHGEAFSWLGENVQLVWQCMECCTQDEIPLRSVVEIGNAVCPDCEVYMALVEVITKGGET